jgi:small subunit ribosomal protein S2
MANVSMKELLEANHFGHQTALERRRPTSSAPNSIYHRSAANVDLNRGYNFIVETVGGQGLFVGTKKQAQEAVAEASGRNGMYYVNNRWLGGMLTNFRTIKKSIDRYKQLETMRDDGTFAKLSKKEAAALNREIEKLQKSLIGIKSMDRLPDALFITT